MREAWVPSDKREAAKRLHAAEWSRPALAGLTTQAMDLFIEFSGITATDLERRAQQAPARLAPRAMES